MWNNLLGIWELKNRKTEINFNKFYLTHYAKNIVKCSLTFDKINHILDYKASHKFEMIEIIQNISSDNSEIKLEINY